MPATPSPSAAPLRRRLLLRCALAAQLLLTLALAHADPEGEALARRVSGRPQGEDLRSAVTMALAEAGGEPRLRRMFLYRFRKPDGEAGTLIRFSDPADIRGTGLLSLERPGGEAEQWVWLPALGRVRRIDAQRRGGRFVNSDYYYEDLRERPVERDHHRVVGREPLLGSDCLILESTPRDPAGSVYQKRLTWVAADTLLPLRIDLFETRPEQPGKRWEALRRERIGGYWSVTESLLTDLDHRHTTRLSVERIEYDRGLPAELFSLRALEDEQVESPFRP